MWSQHAGTTCGPELPSGVLKLKSQGKASHLLWFYLVGLVRRCRSGILFTPYFFAPFPCSSKPQTHEMSSASCLKPLGQAVRILSISFEIFKALIPQRTVLFSPLPSFPSGISVDACSKYLLAPEEIHL